METFKKELESLWPLAKGSISEVRKPCIRPNCSRTVTARPPGGLPKGLYGNQLLTPVAVQHSVDGVTLGQLEKQTGVGYGSLIDAMHLNLPWRFFIWSALGLAFAF